METGDTVRMHLEEIGSTDLLSADEEIHLARTLYLGVIPLCYETIGSLRR